VTLIFTSLLSGDVYLWLPRVAQLRAARRVVCPGPSSFPSPPSSRSISRSFKFPTPHIQDLSSRPLRPPRKPSTLRSLSDRPSRSNLNTHISIPSISGSHHPTVTYVHPNATPQSQRCNTHRKPSSTKPLPFPPLPHNPNYETLFVSRPRQPPLLPNYVLESCPRLLLSPKPRDACTQHHHRRHTSRGSLAAVTTRIAGKTCTASIPVFPSPSLPPPPFLTSSLVQKQFKGPTPKHADFPPPCRAHTATLVDRKIVTFGGGQGPTCYHTDYILDTQSRR